MLAWVKESIRKRLAGIAHDWIVSTYLEPVDENEQSPSRKIPERHTFWMYPREIGWGMGGDAPLNGKRVRVEMTVEDMSTDPERLFDRNTGILGGSYANPIFSHGICCVKLDEEGLYFAVQTDKRFCECAVQPTSDGNDEFEVTANDHPVGTI